MLEQIEDDRHRFLVGNLIGVVDLGVLDDFRDAAEADAFGDRSPGVDLASPCLNSSYIAKPCGSAQATTMPLFFSFRARLVPASVPPVPTEQMKPSTLPPVCCQISGPVVS